MCLMKHLEFVEKNAFSIWKPPDYRTKLKQTTYKKEN